MTSLETDLKQILLAIEKARDAGDAATQAELAERQLRLCNLLAALDPVQ